MPNSLPLNLELFDSNVEILRPNIELSLTQCRTLFDSMSDYFDPMSNSSTQCRTHFDSMSNYFDPMSNYSTQCRPHFDSMSNFPRIDVKLLPPNVELFSTRSRFRLNGELLRLNVELFDSMSIYFNSTSNYFASISNSPQLNVGRFESTSHFFDAMSNSLDLKVERGLIRMQQASEVVSALSDFARGDEQIVLADVNSFATLNSATGGNATNVYDYFTACGYRCAYRAVGKDSNIPSYTTWAGWASGDFRATCDHIFVSKGIHVSAVLDVPSSESLADAFPERLPNRAYPSDHMSLIADLVIT
ncbi:unnamed protein product [Polarella glacialis]|uniref:Endonuclease/exonuclease/phosphatase domain-containing protein n=1 Tax=Polarella glacialis TaxID=89957 RepID=A0A813LXG4_POLGL|nr:unnamed protein product [Polarella glacialis]